MELLAFLDKLSPILIVIIPSYFSFKSTQNTKETDKQISLLSDKISAIEKTVSNVENIGKDNSKGLSVIGKGLQRLQRFRLQENLKKPLEEAVLISMRLRNCLVFMKVTWNLVGMEPSRYCMKNF